MTTSRTLIIKGTTLSLIQGDITKTTADVIVNAANTSLLGGGGVDGAIHKAGGPLILEECRRIRARQGGCAAGEAVSTAAGNLPARHVIHTVGPVWNGGGRNEEAVLASCYANSLALAAELQAASIAFPNISTGIYRFPKPLAAAIAIDTVISYLNTAAPGQHRLEQVLFICMDDENDRIYAGQFLAVKEQA
jgi:O-acetyl-ADP-ribose deacetylase